jgi:threonine/homoserine/homoserine lactone efflux protein
VSGNTFAARFSLETPRASVTATRVAGVVLVGVGALLVLRR